MTGSAAGRAVERVLRTLAGIVRPLVRDPDPGADLRRALSFLDSPIPATIVVRAGYAVAALTAVFTFPVAVFFPVPVSWRPALVAITLSVAFGVAHAVHRGPVLFAALRRTRALGDAPGLVARAVLRMRVTPTVESAAAFAAQEGEGPLATSLGVHVRAAAGTPETGLTAFATAWMEWFPALRRASALVTAAGNAPPDERERTLDRAMTAVLEGTREKMSEFGESVRGPATGLYAFGVLLPLALVAVLPAARVAGFAVPPAVFVAVYTFFLPGGVLAASGWLLVRRPVAFPPPTVPGSHPALPDHRWPAIVVGFGAGVGAAGLALVWVSAWGASVVACGVGPGVALVLASRPVVEVHERVRAVEADLPDALYLVGRRVSKGVAVETAVAHAAGEVPGATGEAFAAAARVGRRLRVDVDDAFLGEEGALADLPSPRARSATALLGVAAREGRPAGAAIVATADHLAELAAVERDARRDLAEVTGTLRNTAAVFGPLVAGATVALAEGMAARAGEGLPLSPGEAATATTPMSIELLGPAVGAYVLASAVVLTTLAVGLDRGLDRALVGHRVGRALCSATAVYVLTYLLAGIVV